MTFAKMVDQNGPEFASEVTRNSLEIQGGLKMSPFETASEQVLKYLKMQQ